VSHCSSIFSVANSQVLGLTIGGLTADIDSVGEEVGDGDGGSVVTVGIDSVGEEVGDGDGGSVVTVSDDAVHALIKEKANKE